ncbi:hypothetical protein B0H17DRAFT_1061330 [Mycena rosella]|uniref:Uncharacterized protein n=1 Tax=Mycena rosella TaxID=1033263 RepID=A0AAD7DJD2_MYCRO|nr:hypothetical protein B0H17DRAFT_1061330 [Mycena rosella]
MSRRSILPLELERHIFELAALSRPVSIPTLLRVAWRIKHWLERMLYMTLVVGVKDPLDGVPSCSVEIFKRIARTKPVFLHDFVRNLMVERIPPEDMRFILSMCRAVENLHILPNASLGPAEHPVISTMPLRHLYCHLRTLDQLIPFESFRHLLFRNITHLELFGGFHEEDREDEGLVHWTGLAALPHLTHLALNSYLFHTCTKILTAYKSLFALLILHPPPTHYSMELASLIDDPRFVMMSLPDFTDDWQRGILVGEDYWARADAFITKRMSGEIDRRDFFLEDGTRS